MLRTNALATWPAPDGLLTWFGVAFDGSRFVAFVRSPATEVDPEPGIAVVALDAQGRSLFRFEPSEAQEGMRASVVPSGGSSELWLFDGRASIDRYALP